ncbi:hypothetical protein [Bradyrhizobium liaoningense]
MAKHQCPNAFAQEGAKGACFFEIEPSGGAEGRAMVRVGWSCVIVCDQEVPISWLSELVAIATGHNGGIAGFLAEHRYGGDSYALMVDPPRKD